MWQVRSLTTFHDRCSQVSLVSVFVKFKGIPSNPNLICSIMTSLRSGDIQCSSLYLCDSDLFHLLVSTTTSLPFETLSVIYVSTLCFLCCLQMNFFLQCPVSISYWIYCLLGVSYLGVKCYLFLRSNFCFPSYRFLYSYWRLAPRMFSMEETAGFENLCICDYWSYILNFYIIKATLNEKSNCKNVCKHGITNIKNSW